MKKSKVVSVLVGMAFLMSSCSLLTPEVEIQETETQVVTSESSETVFQESEEEKPGRETAEIVESEAAEDVTAESEENVLSEAEASGLRLEQTGNYYYNLCTPEEQTVYVEMYRALSLLENEMKLSTLDIDSLSRIYQCVINDHPELFYLSGFTYVKHTLAGELKYLTFSGRNMYTEEEIEERTAKLDGIVKKILSGLPADADEYETVKYLYEYIIENTEYGSSSPDNQNVCSVFFDGISVCNGYAKAMQYLMNYTGIFCTIVNGYAGGSHAWNLVEIDGVYYYVDVTWGDPSYYNDGDVDKITPDIDYSYLCVTTEMIQKNHTMDSEFPLPDCTELTANYFVKENLYFDSFEEKHVNDVFQNAGQSGKTSVIIMAADSEIYHNLYQYLITDQAVFRFFRNENTDGKLSVAYSTNEDLYTLSFWK